MTPACEWCGETANDEQGPVRTYVAGAGEGGYAPGDYHADCRIAYYQHVHGQHALRDNLRLRVRRLVMQFEGDLADMELEASGAVSERDMLEAFIGYVQLASVDTWFDVTGNALHGEDKVRL